MNKVTEWCPNCDTEVEIPALYKEVQRCPNCGEYIIACNLCDCDVEDCAKCECMAKAEKLQQQC